MSAIKLKNEREQLIKELAEIIGNKYYAIFSEYLQLPLISHPFIDKYGTKIKIKFPQWYDSQDIKTLDDLWLNNNYNVDEIEEDIKHLAKIEYELSNIYIQWNETAKLRDLLNKYK